ncbi:hypothetical protein BU23DRAFT_34988 [Bimuria novae-zelandiae CBS 107.79]|uniref:Uncharacterized protein n=1 Tax=Bimuria novae-zelandiae CBS 107.79 TaxID=1447943 RepID=A0A6A5UMV5_9PLEO|nr:hypothetical protein BU23DRAFT_34988 [Bimuria novae-zelandiae CBS 107.79]
MGLSQAASAACGSVCTSLTSMTTFPLVPAAPTQEHMARRHLTDLTGQQQQAQPSVADTIAVACERCGYSPARFSVHIHSPNLGLRRIAACIVASSGAEPCRMRHPLSPNATSMAMWRSHGVLNTIGRSSLL